MLITHKAQRRFILLAALLAIVMTAYRVISGFIEPIPLQVDEAQYLGWSKDLALGYFSKPPFIAWVLAAGRAIASTFGLHGIEGVARMLQAPAFMLAAMMVAASAWQLYRDKVVAAASGILFLTMPLAGFYALVATTDAWLLLWWSLALLAFIFAQSPVIETPQAAGDRLSWWLVCGIAVGFGLLTKYSMAIFAVSAFFYLLANKGLKRPGPWLAVVVASVVFLPNILWNMQTGFPTLRHHAAISEVGDTFAGHWSLAQSLTAAGEFFVGQFAVFGPLAFLVLLWITSRAFSAPTVISNRSSKFKDYPQRSEHHHDRLLLTFTWPMLGIILLQAFISRAHANWAAPAYVAASILVAASWMRHGDSRKSSAKSTVFFSISILLGLLVSIAIIQLPGWLKQHPAAAHSKLNTLPKLNGWREAAIEASQLAHAGSLVIVAEDRQLLAAISAYGLPGSDHPLAWNPQHLNDSHYRWFYDLADAKPRDGQPADKQSFLLLIIGSSEGANVAAYQQAFVSITPINDPVFASITVGRGNHRVWAYRANDFRGY